MRGTLRSRRSARELLSPTIPVPKGLQLRSVLEVQTLQASGSEDGASVRERRKRAEIERW